MTETTATSPPISMISADEARHITDAVNFAKSDLAATMNIAIRKTANMGKNRVNVWVETDLADAAAQFLTEHGFRVVVKNDIAGFIVEATW